MTNARRELIAVAETVAPYLSDGAIGELIELMLRRAGEGAARVTLDVNRGRASREISDPREREPS
jgi:hypothetical protein